MKDVIRTIHGMSCVLLLFVAVIIMYVAFCFSVFWHTEV